MKSNTEMSKQIDLEKLREMAEDDVKRGRQWSTNSRNVLMLLDHIAELEKENASLKQDVARMDWMDKQGRVCIERVREGHIKGDLRWDVEYGHNDDSAKSKQGMRQAIDAAMEASNA